MNDYGKNFDFYKTFKIRAARLLSKSELTGLTVIMQVFINTVILTSSVTNFARGDGEISSKCLNP